MPAHGWPIWPSVAQMDRERARAHGAHGRQGGPAHGSAGADLGEPPTRGSIGQSAASVNQMPDNGFSALPGHGGGGGTAYGGSQERGAWKSPRRQRSPTGA